MERNKIPFLATFYFSDINKGLLMAKEAVITTDGVVVEVLPGTMFRVRLSNGIIFRTA